ncbi:MlaE family ABC transporter permease [Amycolatopsis sp. NPDC059027]|uniref:MlaE family ABC transporter permease n=1 Tax=Amycolatopsis sp. NPDC059027 TaxID=3346709 RepID=UPI00366F783C
MTAAGRGRSGSVAEVGVLFGFAADTAVAGWRTLSRRRFAWREALEQMWFLAGVTAVPAILVMIPFGVVVAAQVGALTGQIGAQSYSGAVVGLLVVGQAAPLVCALMIAGVGGSAMCADLGARTIREETDALEVMGLPVLERLVLPRIVAAVVVTMLMDSLVMAVGITASFLFQVVVQGVPAGSFLGTLTDFAHLSDFLVSQLKSAVFALLAASVACFKGITAKGGPDGVGNAVNEAVVLAFLLVFFANVGIGELYALAVPPDGGF